MATGTSVKKEVVDQYKDMVGKYGYLQIKLCDDYTSVEIDKVVKQDLRTKEEEEKAYSEFLKQLPSQDCRYVVYNYHTEIEGSDRILRVFINWSPSSASTKTKMIFISTKEAVRRELIGISMEIIAESTDDLDYEKVLAKTKN